jgi:hypothetical protein
MHRRDAENTENTNIDTDYSRRYCTLYVDIENRYCEYTLARQQENIVLRIVLLCVLCASAVIR